MPRWPKPYFATAYVPIEANTAAAIPGGIVVVVAPKPLVETKSGPQTAPVADTAQMTTIARDAHISAASNRADHAR